MNLKSTLLTLVAAAAALSANAEGSAEVITLDLTKADTPLEFNAETGAWTQTYNEEEPTIDSQLYCFLHSALTDYDTWWGWTASNSANNAPQSNYIKYQFSNMAKGGIVLDENGAVKLNEQGAPVVSAEVPYMVGYYNAYMAKRPVQLLFNDGFDHEAVGVYVNLNSYPYYTMLCGDAYCRAFTNKDKFTLTIHGVSSDNTEKTVDVTLGECNNGVLAATTGWSYVDLTPLGAINELYFTMSSTDSGAWGMNTPGYFCLDKLQVKKDAAAGVEAAAAAASLAYNREAGVVSAAAGSLVALYGVDGKLLKSTDNGVLSMADMPHGVYVARSGNASIKIAR